MCSRVGQPQHSHCADCGAIAIVDADHRDSCSARRQHPEQRRDPFEACAVADAGGHSDYRLRAQAAEHGRKRAFHAGDNDDDVGFGDAIDFGKQTVQTRDADVVDAIDLDAVGAKRGGAFVGDRGVGGVLMWRLPDVTTTHRIALVTAGTAELDDARVRGFQSRMLIVGGAGDDDGAFAVGQQLVDDGHTLFG